MRSSQARSWRRTALALLLFSLAFGYVEAAVVMYLRQVSQPVVSRHDLNRPSYDLFPLLTPEQLRAAPEQERLFKAEFVREIATLVMLAAVGVAATRGFGQGFAAFAIAFGAWDIFFYAWLKVLLAWPSSLLTWDLLFLVPVPWVAPVLAPVLVSVSLIGAGTLILRRDWSGRPVIFRPAHWLVIAAGMLIIVLSFTWGYHRILSGGVPSTFNWPLFLFGEAIWLGSFLHALRLPKQPLEAGARLGDPLPRISPPDVARRASDHMRQQL